MLGRRPWREELEIIDNTMRAISSISDPEQLVSQYYGGIGELLPINDFMSLSRRNVPPPQYLVTRSSRFTEDINPFTQRERLPRLSGGIAGEVIYANKPVIIDDLPSRLRDDDPARFYLQGFQAAIGLPQYDGGESLNATLLLLPPGNQFDPAIIPMLHWQAGLFGRGTNNLVLRNQLAGALAAIEREFHLVGEIQRSLLPEVMPAIPGLDLAAHYQTSARAGGDYYDLFPLSTGQWGLFIADVAGHGAPAAVLMAITRALVHAQPLMHAPPDVLLACLNEQLTRSYTRNGTFVTAFYATFDPKTRSLTYATAGHNPPRLARAGQIIPLNQNAGLPLGIIPEAEYGQATLKLQPADLLLLYTDGITEAFSPPRAGQPRQLFGTDRLDALLLDRPSSSAADCVTRITDAIAAYSENAPPTDDRTLIAIRCTI